MYQTSAPIAQGNSGGPLIHLETGKVVGINSAIIDQGAIGFSIPVSQVIAKAEEWTGYKLDGSTPSTGKIRIMSRHQGMPQSAINRRKTWFTLSMII